MLDSLLRIQIAALSLIAALLLVAGCGGSSDTTTGTNTEKTTKSAAAQGGSRKDNVSSKTGSAKKPAAANYSSRNGAGEGRQKHSSVPQAQEDTKRPSNTRTTPPDYSQNSHDPGSNPQPGGTNPQKETHSGRFAPAPTTEAQPGSNSH